MSKILFITSNNTGHGHKSITEALYQQFEKLNPEIYVEEIDAFALGGVLTEKLADLYNKVAVNTPKLWGSIYKFGNKCTPFVNLIAECATGKNMIKSIKKIRPDLIVTVHPAFVSSILNLLEKHGLNIPVVVFIADLDNVSHLWADKRTLFTLCPTKESYNSMLELGIPKEKLKIFGFPTRDTFNHLSAENVDMSLACSSDNSSINFLIMNGSQGGNYSKEIAERLLENFNCNVTILAGRNEKLKKFLENRLISKYGNRVTVLGFTNNVKDYMMKSDILILRASPNVLMEAINLCKPIIITGAFAGQEEKNPQFVINNNLGVQCKDLNMLPQVVNDLMADDCKKLREIQKSQLEFRQPNAAGDIVKFIAGLL